VQFVAGVDCHKDSHTIVFLDPQGRLIRQLTIRTSESGFRRAVEVRAKSAT